jgi:hypothetical protein
MSARSLAFAPAAVILSLSILSAGATRAQSVEDWRQTEDAEKKPLPKLEQSYHGVTPGSGNPLPRVDELKNKEGTWVTWPGFVIRSDGGSRVFLQTTVSVEYRLTEKNNRISLELKDAHIFLSNNRNPLVTTHFNTPLMRAYLKEQKEVTELVLDLKLKQSPIITQTVDKDGYHYMFIDFPPGQYPIINLKAENPNAENETSEENYSFSNNPQ